MAKKKSIMTKFIFIIILIFICTKTFAENIIDQWKDSDLTYKDLIESGFEVKAYSTSSIIAEGGITIMFFVTVLQKNKEVYECQEYQTVDGNLQTLDLSFICRKITQPYKRGIGT